MKNEWIEWSGGVQPVPDGTTIEFEMRSGTACLGDAEKIRWTHWGSGGDVTRYRVVNASPAPLLDGPEFVAPTLPAGQSALQRQEGGDHYKKLKIQPIDFIHANSVPFMEANVVKYIVRHKAKNGAADIRKAIHYCQMLLELEYGEKS